MATNGIDAKNANVNSFSCSVMFVADSLKTTFTEMINANIKTLCRKMNILF